MSHPQKLDRTRLTMFLWVANFFTDALPSALAGLSGVLEQ